MRTAESIPSTISDHSPRPETPCSKHSMKRDSDSMGLSSKGMFFGALLVLGVMRSRMVEYNVIVGAGNISSDDISPRPDDWTPTGHALSRLVTGTSLSCGTRARRRG